MNVKIINIEHLQFATFEENYFTNNENISLDFKVAFDIDTENKLFKGIILYNFSIDDKIFLKNEVLIEFMFKEEFWKNTKVKNQILISKETISKVLDISIHTIRGVLYEKLSNTKLSNFIFPMLDIDKMISEDAILQTD